MKYLVVVPDGVGIRNFLCMPMVDDLLEQGGEVIVWHDLPEGSIAPYRDHWKAQAVRWEKLPPFRDGLPERVLRKARNFAQIHWQRDPGWREMLKKKRPSGRWTSRLVSRAAQLVGRLGAGPRRARWLDRLYERALARAPYMDAFRKFLQQEEADVVFCTHQRAWQAAPALQAARDLGLPAVTFIYSWDNLPKDRSAVPADVYFVWGPHMEREMHRYYPSLRESQVNVTGTPQFEPYFDDELIEPRASFLEDVGLDPERPVVCFSGDDELTSPHDPLYLRDLARGLREVPVPRRPQILFRHCPVDDPGRYRPVLEEYDEIAVSAPAWQSYGGERWQEIVPTMEDVTLLANVVHHCDAVVNLGSTVALDFALLDKPAVYVNYEHAPPANGELGARGVYRLPHFESVHEHQPVHWATSAEELPRAVLHALAHPEEKHDARQAWINEVAERPLGEASRRCAEALMDIAHTSNAARASNAARRETTSTGTDGSGALFAKIGET